MRHDYQQNWKKCSSLRNLNRCHLNYKCSAFGYLYLDASIYCASFLKENIFYNHFIKSAVLVGKYAYYMTFATTMEQQVYHYIRSFGLHNISPRTIQRIFYRFLCILLIVYAIIFYARISGYYISNQMAHLREQLFEMSSLLFFFFFWIAFIDTFQNVTFVICIV